MCLLCRSVLKITVQWAPRNSTWSCWLRSRGNSRPSERGKKGKKKRDGDRSFWNKKRETSDCLSSKKTRVRHCNAFNYCSFCIVSYDLWENWSCCFMVASFRASFTPSTSTQEEKTSAQTSGYTCCNCPRTTFSTCTSAAQ